MSDENEQPEEEQLETAEPAEEETPEQSDGEPETDEAEVEESSTEEEDAPKKKKGKSRNQRMSAKIARLEEENEEIKANFMLLNSQIAAQAAPPQAGQLQQPQGTVPQAQQPMAAPLDQQSAIHNIKMQKFAKELNDLRAQDESVDDIMSDPSHPYMQLDNVAVSSLPHVGLSPQTLFEINNKFPKEVKRLRGQSADGQIATLLRLDGKLDALKSTRQDNLKNAPAPTGVLKGGSAKVSGKLSPAEQLAKLRKAQYGR